MADHRQAPGRRRWRSATLAALAALTAATIVASPATPAHADRSCVEVDIETTTWPTGPDTGTFLLSITLTNQCQTVLHQWTLSLTFPAGATMTAGWSADWSQAGQSVTASSAFWTPALNPGGSLMIGAMGSYTGGFTGPASCSINGVPCDGGAAPEVTLTAPSDGANLVYPCPVVLGADATAPGGEVDRVEFYVDDVLVGTDAAAPYELTLPSGTIRANRATAFARVYDTADPPRSAESDRVSFNLTIPPPGLMIIPCTRDLVVPEGGAGSVEFFLSANDTVPVDLTVTGTGVTVDPGSFALDGMVGQEVVVEAAPGAAGTTATITASAPGYSSATVNVEVVAGP